MHGDLIDGRLEEALFACIAAQGVDGVTIDDVARRLGRSRAALYRQFGSWPQLLACAHWQVIEMFNDHFPRGGENRRLDFERWWSGMLEFFRTPSGRGVLALRHLTATRIGLDQLEEEELARLPVLVKWINGSRVVTKTTWRLLLSATDASFDDAQRAELREIVWSIVAVRVALGQADELDLSAAVPLSGLL